ncbi:galactose-1-epimerase [Mesorhizobium sp. NBSH29]|uniref:aldose epimerase family protein n=1 Tax=Mesorhizobium sp. NBSH29 TaxID=2654249 RepID=UPI0018964748|nr:aldose epimerase family protein [Mesorhizobium sp. NBSH29]QPC88050.1 galactose-1-epimerase [Mesorhizobium sp. NBSH29]
MGGDAHPFGTMADGGEVQIFPLEAGGLSARIMTYGAAVQDLRLAGHDAPLVLGFDAFEAYPMHSPFFGAIAGRYANRIANGRFALSGVDHQVDTNENGRHHLHGGSCGFSAKAWQAAAHGRDFVSLTHHSPDGDMGFAGALDVTCTYRLKIPGTLSVELTATTDQPTLCNLAHHSYFNLDDGGSGDVRDHRISIAAHAYLPIDDDMIPTGVVLPVDGTTFDFRTARPIRMADACGAQVLYDHNFCIADARGPLRPMARLEGARSGVTMDVLSTEPGLQFYAGHGTARTVPGLGGRSYGAYAGLCLEPQFWPDSPNRPYFPQAILWPGAIYRQTTEYRFSKR